ncbi:LIC_13387 family protein [Ramlibacter sp. MMS24-I3-19]|uniref:LIC_13387 family protein n=1 Tax=Ramlibacter sp. MMS24-I3-19 TaxID=3416606 RepID=UPI003D027231
MTAARLFKAVAALYVIFALGHTAGFLLFVAPTAQARAAFEAMRVATFQVGPQTFSYAGFYRGFGLTVTFLLLLCAALAWILAGIVDRGESSAKPLTWSLALVQCAVLVTSLTYFGLPPIVLSVAILLLIAAAGTRISGHDLEDARRKTGPQSSQSQ